MNDPIYPSETKKESNVLTDMILIGAGLMFMLIAFGLLALFMVRNGRAQAADPADTEGYVYDGNPISHVPAGSRKIEALAYSNQVPVVVMFDADW